MPSGLQGGICGGQGCPCVFLHARDTSRLSVMGERVFCDLLMRIYVL